MTPAPVGLRCPEHSGKPQGVRRAATVAAERRVPAGSIAQRAPVTLALIALNVGVYLTELGMGGTTDGTGNKLWLNGSLFAHLQYSDGTYHGVAAGEWWRLITAAFLHYGPIHLGMNMLALYWFGPILEGVVGRWRYFMLYIASGLAGSAGALWLNPNAITVGASGAIFGVLGALLVLERRGVIMSGGQILMLVVINLVFTFAVGGLSLGLGTAGISIGGHIGGLAAGIALMNAYMQLRRSPRLSLAAALVVAVVSVAVAYAVV
jgi:membrane associated rhomboid family serine protease